MDEATRPVLVLGGRGYLGRALVARLSRRWPVDAPPRSAVDVTDSVAVRRIVASLRPRAIVNLAAAHGEHALEETNVAGAGNVAIAAAEHGSRLVHFSSDVVLNGLAPPYADDAPATPVSAYGRSKAGGERSVLASAADAVLVRTSLIWDPTEIGRGTSGFAARLARGEPCRLFTDEVRCPVTRATLCAAVERLLSSDYVGTLNVAGDEALTRYDFGTLLLEHFDVPGRERVEPALASEVALPPGESRPVDLTLDVRRAAALLGVAMTGVRAALAARRSNGLDGSSEGRPTG